MPTATATPPAKMTLPTELHDEGGFGAVCALQVKHYTRGQARALFAREWDISFPQVRMSRTHYFDCPDYRAEMEEDGIEEPYDGWPLTECRATTPGAAEFWFFDKEASHVD